MPFDHIHFGAGRRSLGVTLPLSIDAGGSVHVIVHTASEVAPNCELVCGVCSSTGERRDARLTVASVASANTIDELDEQVLTVVEEAPELLLTTAITSAGIEAQGDFLLDLARARGGKRTVCIPCEEAIDDGHLELLAELIDLGVEVRRSVVNRLCSLDEAETSVDRRVVRVDHDVEWLIEGTASGALLGSLGEVRGVAFTPHIKEHDLRNRWLAEGIRLILALLAAERGQQQMHFEALELTFENWLQRIYSDFIPLVEARCPELSDTAEFARKQIAMFVRYDDDPKLVVSKLRRENVLPLLSDLECSVGEPCRALVKAGSPLPDYLRRVFHAIDLALCDIERYTDYKLYITGKMRLDEESDEQVVEAYEKLISGILAPKEVEERVITLDNALTRHRAGLG